MLTAARILLVAPPRGAGRPLRHRGSRYRRRFARHRPVAPHPMLPAPLATMPRGWRPQYSGSSHPHGQPNRTLGQSGCIPSPEEPVIAQRRRAGGRIANECPSGDPLGGYVDHPHRGRAAIVGFWVYAHVTGGKDV